MAAERERLTTRGYDPKTATVNKKADPYTMNQPRRPGSNPSATKYENGSPDSWAETPISEDIWKEEYAKGRNEVGTGNFLDNTFEDRQHPGTPGAPAPKYENKTSAEALKVAANERAAHMADAKRLASKALHLTHAIFPTAGEKFIFAQARDFMNLPETSLDRTISRILKAGEEMEEEGEEKEAKKAGDEAEEEEEEKTAGEVPEAFKKQWEKNKGDKEEEDKGKEDKKGTISSDISRLQSRLASLKASIRKAGEDTEEEKEEKEASLQMIASLERRLAALRSTVAGEAEAEEEEEDEEKTASRLQAAAARLAGRKTSGEEEEEEEKEAKKAGEEMEEEEKEAKKAGEEEEEDKTAGELDIELGTPSMETASEADLLEDIFTASSKTASTRPAKKGISKLGGGTKVASHSIDELSSLWKSDPDVSGDFR